jgi:hypothetical protein
LFSERWPRGNSGPARRRKLQASQGTRETSAEMKEAAVTGGFNQIS